MKTRTLLLLSLGCGLAIMLAGAVFLFQLATQDDVAEPISLGEPARVGDMTVVVEGADERGGVLVVDVRIGGVDDDDGGRGFRLIAAGRPIAALPADEGDCLVTMADAVSCSVRFDVGSADGTSRVLFYERGEESARWVLG